MKLSEMNTNEACDAVVRLTEPISNISNDPQMEKALKDIAGLQGQMTALQALSTVFPKLVPNLLKDHLEDVYEIISILSGLSVAEIGKMKFTETIKVLRECIDKDLLDFFK